MQAPAHSSTDSGSHTCQNTFLGSSCPHRARGQVVSRADRALSRDTLLGTRHMLSPWSLVSHRACCDATGGLGECDTGGCWHHPPLIIYPLWCQGTLPQYSPLSTVPLLVLVVSRHRDIWGPHVQVCCSSELTLVLL